MCWYGNGDLQLLFKTIKREVLFMSTAIELVVKPSDVLHIQYRAAQKQR